MLSGCGSIFDLPDANPDADQDSDIILMRIWIRLFHPDADQALDPEPSFQIKAQTLEKGLK
jgi:hypothetical protein